MAEINAVVLIALNAGQLLAVQEEVGGKQQHIQERNQKVRLQLVLVHIHI